MSSLYVNWLNNEDGRPHRGRVFRGTVFETGWFDGLPEKVRESLHKPLAQGEHAFGFYSYLQIIREEFDSGSKERKSDGHKVREQPPGSDDHWMPR